MSYSALSPAGRADTILFHIFTGLYPWLYANARYAGHQLTRPRTHPADARCFGQVEGQDVVFLNLDPVKGDRAGDADVVVLAKGAGVDHSRMGCRPRP